MNEWQRRELEQLRKENEWFERLPAWMKVIDNHLYFVLILVIGLMLGFNIGFMIGLML